MPIFLYKCVKCGETVEKLQPNSSTPPPNRCESCGEIGTLEKQISAPSGFILKGNGWYKTDFKNQ